MASIAITTKMNLNTIKKRADAGDVDCIVALADFYKSVADRNFVVVNEASVQVLTDLVLIDDITCKVHDATRKALSACK